MANRGIYIVGHFVVVFDGERNSEMTSKRRSGHH